MNLQVQPQAEPPVQHQQQITNHLHHLHHLHLPSLNINHQITHKPIMIKTNTAKVVMKERLQVLNQIIKYVYSLTIIFKAVLNTMISIHVVNVRKDINLIQKIMIAIKIVLRLMECVMLCNFNRDQ